MPVTIELSDEEFEQYKTVAYSVNMAYKSGMAIYPQDAKVTLAVLAATQVLTGKYDKAFTANDMNTLIERHKLPLRAIEV